MKRALEFRGSLDLQLLSGVVPVVLVNDATKAGYRALVERGWMYGEIVAGGANWPHFAIKAPANRSIIIEKVHVNVGLANTAWSIGLLGPNDADPWAIAQLNIRWTERLQATTEITGILSGPQIADAVQYGIPIMTENLGQPTNSIWHDVDVVLEPNAKLIVQGHAGMTCSFGFKGRAL